MYKIFIKTSKYLILALLIQWNLVSYAQYEIFSAKTVKHKTEIQKTNKNSELTTDDFAVEEDEEFPNSKPIGNTFIKKTKNFFNKVTKDKSQEEDNKETKNTTENPLPDEDDVENDIDIENNVENNENEITDNTEENQEENKSYTKKDTYSSYDLNKETTKIDCKYQINADKISYDDTEGNLYAKGDVEIIAKEKDVKIKADEAILDKNSQTIKLINNVKVIKNGVEMQGEYLLIDLNEQNALMDNPTIEAYSFNINAQEGYIIANDIQAVNGTIYSDRKETINFESRAFQSYENIALDYVYRKRNGLTDKERKIKQAYRIDAKEIILTSYKDHNSLILKKANVYYNNHKIIPYADIEIITDKETQVVETSVPEAGKLREFGTYIGYGYVAKLPKGQTLKLMPALVYNSDRLGYGLIARHRTPNNKFEIGVASPHSKTIARGLYKITDYTHLRYGKNSYISEGFMGARRPGYAIQLENYQNFRVDGVRGMTYRQGIYAGYFNDYRRYHTQKARASSRFRYSGELRKKIFEYRNEEQDLGIRLSLLAEGAATVYGTGDTHAVFLAGPTVTTKLKFWESSVGYVTGGVHGRSPFRFDRYRYGKHVVMFNEKIHFGDKFAVGYRAYISPLRDNTKKRLVTESRFYAMAGPEDIKLVLSYDFIREIARCEFMFLIGTDSARINFEKLTTQNLDGKNDDFYRHAKRVKIVDPEQI